MCAFDILGPFNDGRFPKHSNIVLRFGVHNEVTLHLIVMYDDMVDMLQEKFVSQNDVIYVYMYDDILLRVLLVVGIRADGTEVDVEGFDVILERGFILNEVEVEQM